MLGTGIGWTEMLVIAGVALIVVGPRDLPAMLRQVGRMVGMVRRMGNDFRREFNKMAAMDDMRDMRESLTNPLRNARAEIEREFNKPTSSGVEPSGVLTPDEGEGESVVNAIKTQAGMTDAAEAKADMDAALKESVSPITSEVADTPLDLVGNSIAGAAATPKPKRARKPRAKTAAAQSAKPAESKSEKPKVAAKPKGSAKAATKSKTATTATAKPEATPSVAAKPAATKSKAAAAKATRSRAASASKATKAASAATEAKPAKTPAAKASKAEPASGEAKPVETKPAASAKPRAARKPAASKSSTSTASRRGTANKAEKA